MPFGEFQYNLDDKGRVIVPPTFRDFLADGVVLTRGFEGCLYVYPKVTWHKIEAVLKDLPLVDGESRALVRFLYSGASPATMDATSRITLNNTLRRFAGIDHEVIFAGAPNRLEIWNEALWLSTITDLQNAPPAPERLMELVG